MQKKNFYFDSLEKSMFLFQNDTLMTHIRYVKKRKIEKRERGKEEKNTE